MILAGIISTLLGATAILAHLLGRRVEHQATAIAIGGSAVPLFILAASIFFVFTDGPDGPPPGMVLMGNLVLAAVLAPITLLESAFFVRRARRQACLQTKVSL